MAATIRGRTRPTAPKPQSDAYVGMLFVSLLALIVGAAFLWLEYSQYDNKKLPALPDRAQIPTTKGAGEGQQPPPPPPKDGKGM